jgi:hypothetical protein
VEDEGCTLGRGQPVEHLLKREADGVVERDPIRGFGKLRGAFSGVRVRFGGVATSPAEPVEAEPSDDDHEPAADVVDPVDAVAYEASKCFLHDVLGIAEVAEHAEGDVEGVAAVVSPRPSERHIHVGRRRGWPWWAHRASPR